MKIQCDVCEKAQATVICCADEAALCTKCDIKVHAANKFASKHQRLLLQCLSNKLPVCDICQDKTAFIFCVEDRALFCNVCDESIHSASSSLSAKHQRLLATGIRLGLSSSYYNDAIKSQMERQPPKQSSQQLSIETTSQHLPNIALPSLAVDGLLGFSERESNHKKEQLELDELKWLKDIGLFGEQPAAAVPDMSISQSRNVDMPNKKPRVEIPYHNEYYFTVPNLG
ncbi:B-box zinc finger protein 24 [Nicotiana tabacum]|uniref:B-box zinc finger protein 24 n=2 Tax=Nicotiana tabacum TaxID=4097 RepID=A0A1S4A376_TOBAC|nr:PREDICTED: B-box zinc finger protein 24-like [Nicotiana tabacum]